MEADNAPIMVVGATQSHLGRFGTNGQTVPVSDAEQAERGRGHERPSAPSGRRRVAWWTCPYLPAELDCDCTAVEPMDGRQAANRRRTPRN